MIRIAHAVVPIVVPSSHELSVAQPITFASMRAAAANARQANVSLCGITFTDEADCMPDGFTALPSLTRSIGDVRTFRQQKKLALLRDILDRLTAVDCDYCIYTNVDIALQPDFYDRVADFIAKGYDAFVINRRTIPDSYTSPDQLSAMYKEQGLPHPGYDCFVFKKDLYAQFIVGDVCIGTGQVDTPLVCSMIAAANKFGEFTDEHLTFHIGDSRQWLKWRYRDYFFHNCREASVSIRALLQGKAKQLPARGRILLWLRLPKNTVMIPMIKRLFSQ